VDDYYILCPTRETSEPALISHLIGRDLCRKRQSENFHKCPNCVLSDLWRKAHPAGYVPAAKAD
jgi:hypothetical protein